MADTYKIGEAASLLNLKAYVLRFWETEFPDIVPLRTAKGQRLYTDEHLALLERIRYLLHDRGLTISGARKVLAEEKERGLVYTREGVRQDQQSGSNAVAAPFPPTPQPGPAPYASQGVVTPADTPIDPYHVDPYYYPAQESRGSSALARERDNGADRPGQYNLPGIEKNTPEYSPLPDGLMTGDTITTSLYMSEEEPAAPVRSEENHVLSLFRAVNADTAQDSGSQARTGLPVSPASPGTTGTTVDNSKELREALMAKNAAEQRVRHESERFRTKMGDILDELQNIASLLRG